LPQAKDSEQWEARKGKQCEEYIVVVFSSILDIQISAILLLENAGEPKSSRDAADRA
jgi:hypothetical protein